MSFSTRSTSDGSVQESIYSAIAAERIKAFPRGIILRYEHTEKFRAFLAGNPHITYVMINFVDAERILADFGSLRAVLAEWQIPIVTATDEDGDIYNRQADEIRRLLRRIQPAIYIPDAGTVYWDRSSESQRRGLKVFIKRLDWVMAEVDTHEFDIHVLPLAKGMYRWHYEILRDCYHRHEFSNYAFYTKQYVGGRRGNSIRKLLDHMQNLIDVMDPENVFAIARHGSTHIRQFPPQVTGASGIADFARNCKVNGGFVNDAFRDWRAERELDLLNKETLPC